MTITQRFPTSSNAEMRFEYRPYRRSFRRSLQTSHGVWTVREGIILRLTDDHGCVGFGEIAPLSWFGSETFEEAIEFCQQLPDGIYGETIAAIPAHLSACQFGFESAWETLQPFSNEHTTLANSVSPQSPPALGDFDSCSPQTWGARGAKTAVTTDLKSESELTYSALLPTGFAALDSWQDLWSHGYRTFKWKIGVTDIEDEIQRFEQLADELPAKAFLRLDANAGLTVSQAEMWLQHCDSLNNPDRPTLEFLEQPLAVGQFDQMQELSQKHSTSIALDESVATLDQLRDCYQKGWRGIFVIKPAIVGSPSQLRKFCQETAIDAVFSSVFETAIGQQAGLRLAAELSLKNRAVGYGTAHWFDELMEEGERLWQRL